jgi:hypothetical protein
MRRRLSIQQRRRRIWSATATWSTAIAVWLPRPWLSVAIAVSAIARGDHRGWVPRGQPSASAAARFRSGVGFRAAAMQARGIGMPYTAAQMRPASHERRVWCIRCMARGGHP